MDKYDFEQIDKVMSKKMDDIYKDPLKHKFCSEYDEDEFLDSRGVRGGKVRGRKRKCAYCGHDKAEHPMGEQKLRGWIK